MRARRGEACFVAVRMGLWTDPKTLLLARYLGVNPNEAGAITLRWEELVLAAGDARTGRVKGYTMEHVAVAVGWEGRPKKLSDGLRRAGLISSRKRTLLHPFWAETITGQYAISRAENRDRMRKARAPGVDDAEYNSAQVVHSARTDANGARTDGAQSRSINQGSPDSHPPAPPQEGGGVGHSRWEWLAEHHDRPRNKTLCVRLLGELNDEDWALCQYALTRGRRGGGGIYMARKRVLKLSSDRFLSSRGFDEFLPDWRRKLAQENAPPPEPPPAEPPVQNGDAFLLQALADPERPEAEKRKLKERWRKEHPEQTPPWEVH